MGREVSWVDKIVDRIETALVGVTDPILRRRMMVYRLRTLGYTIHAAAEELNISYGTAQGDIEWCYRNLPPAYANAEEFRFIAIGQLEEQYQRVMRPRTVLEQTESGDTVERIELPSLVAEKVGKEIKAEQAKLLGAYRTAVIDEGPDTVTYSVTVSRPRFEEGGAEVASGQPQTILEGAAVPVGSSTQTGVDAEV